MNIKLRVQVTEIGYAYDGEPESVREIEITLDDSSANSVADVLGRSGALGEIVRGAIFEYRAKVIEQKSKPINKVGEAVITAS